MDYEELESSPEPTSRVRQEEGESSRQSERTTRLRSRREELRQRLEEVDDDDDDDDEDYHSQPDEDEEEEEGEEEEEEDDDEYHDAEDGEVEVEFFVDNIQNADAEEDDDPHEAAATLFQNHILNILGAGGNAPIQVTRDATGRLLAIMRGAGLSMLVGDDDDDDDNLWGSRRRRPRPLDPNRFPKVPSEKGRELMESGFFGAFDIRNRDRKRLALRILDRELGIVEPRLNQQLMMQDLIPSSKPEMVIHYDDPVCCGQFSDDGNFYYTVVKDFKVRLYDTSSPFNWKHYKTAYFLGGSWTMTDAHLSPDNKWLAYSSLSSNVAIMPTDPNDKGDPYDLELGGGGGRGFGGWGGGGFAIFSVRFSGDGRTIVAGTGANSIVVYDIERRQVLHHVAGHEDDVNAVCFADKLSPHILYSGSDDCTIKVWDTRSVGDGREAGAFVGHIEGLTYIDSKGDGRYVLSNGKDQSMKLWDLRMAMSSARYEELDPIKPLRRQRHNYDYRWEPYDETRWFPLEHDNSLVTFRGHKVSRTLIRCHFSPPGSTNSRYVYSGSQDGFVYVWNLDATLKTRIDVKSTAQEFRQRHAGGRLGSRRWRRHQHGDLHDWATLIRDVGWHPNVPMLATSVWGGPGMDLGMATVHAFNESEEDEGDPPMGISVDEKLAPMFSREQSESEQAAEFEPMGFRE